MSARRRGHILMETLVAGALMLVAITATTNALVQASRDAAIARDDQRAFALAEAQLEQLRALPLSHARWAAGVTGPTALTTAGWTQTITITNTPDPGLAGVTLKQVVVQIDHQGRTARVESMRWSQPPP